MDLATVIGLIIGSVLLFFGIISGRGDIRLFISIIQINLFFSDMYKEVLDSIIR